MGEINRQLMLHHYGSIFFFSSYDKAEKDNERIRIGKRIKEIRLEKGLDAKTLATVAGIDAANLCRIEAGKYSVGLDVLTKIARVCGKQIDFVEQKNNDYECQIDNREK
jgi:DNA-binding XRE family transcriptional regulator